MYRVYMRQWTDQSKNFIKYEDDIQFAYEKGWDGKNNDFIEVVGYIGKNIKGNKCKMN